MSQILAIDYGLKRSGIAHTDDLQMMAFGLTAVDTSLLTDFLRKYLKEHLVSTLIIGEPKDLQGNMNEIEKPIQDFITQIQKEFPTLEIDREDERFTSKMAQRSLIDMGKKKKDRQNKYLVDEVSATLILQSYLERIQK